MWESEHGTPLLSVRRDDHRPAVNEDRLYETNGYAVPYPSLADLIGTQSAQYTQAGDVPQSADTGIIMQAGVAPPDGDWGEGGKQKGMK